MLFKIKTTHNLKINPSLRFNFDCLQFLQVFNSIALAMVKSKIFDAKNSWPELDFKSIFWQLPPFDIFDILIKVSFASFSR